MITAGVPCSASSRMSPRCPQHVPAASKQPGGGKQAGVPLESNRWRKFRGARVQYRGGELHPLPAGEGERRRRRRKELSLQKPLPGGPAGSPASQPAPSKAKGSAGCGRVTTRRSPTQPAATAGAPGIARLGVSKRFPTPTRPPPRYAQRGWAPAASSLGNLNESQKFARSGKEQRASRAGGEAVPAAPSSSPSSAARSPGSPSHRHAVPQFPHSHQGPFFAKEGTKAARLPNTHRATQLVLPATGRGLR